MKLGDFFQNAATCRPINPRPITLTLIARGNVLPGGHKNPTGGVHRADATAALVYLSGDETAAARLEARRCLQERCIGNEGEPSITPNDGDFELELMYHILHACVHEWDEAEKKVGDRLFPSVTNARELLTVREANRIYAEYVEYLADEHPEVPSKNSFRDSKKRG